MTTITVNGKQHEVAAAPDTPLLYVLRNELELNGPSSAAASPVRGVHGAHRWQAGTLLLGAGVGR